jgi:glycosyltransferase involved in cell wall biosynthesis
MRIVGFELNYTFRDDNGVLLNRTSAVDYFRITQPLKYLQKHTDWHIEIRRDPFVNGDKNWEDITKNFDVIFTGYNIAKEAAYINIRVHGMHNNCPVVVDMDDNIWEIDETNPVYERIHPGTEDHSRIEAIIKDSPHVTCTQPFLKDRILHYTHRPSVFTHVLGNNIDLTLYNPEEHKEDDRITLFYAGSHTHFRDVNHLDFVRAVHRIMEKYPNVDIWCMGMMTNIFNKFGNRYRYIPGHSDFMEFIKIWNHEVSFADIAVIPLHTSNFSKSKSSLKFLEMSAAKLPSVVSGVYPYKRERNSDIIYANSQEDWYKNLEMLVLDVNLRRKIGEKNYKYVKENRNIDKNWVQYKELFEHIASV